MPSTDKDRQLGYTLRFPFHRVQTRLRHISIPVSCIFNGKWRSALCHPECFACFPFQLSCSSACLRRGQWLRNSHSITRKYRLKGFSKRERKIGTGGLTVMFTQSAIVARCALHVSCALSSMSLCLLFDPYLQEPCYCTKMIMPLCSIDLCSPGNVDIRRICSSLQHAVSPCDEGTACLKVHFERGNAQVFSTTESTAFNY